MQSSMNWQILILVAAVSVASAVTVAGLLFVWFRSRRKSGHGGEE